MRLLTIFNFETGDQCGYWQEIRILQTSKEQLNVIEDSLSSYLDSDESEDKEYSDMVDDVLNAVGIEWIYVTGKIPECDYIYTFWI